MFDVQVGELFADFPNRIGFLLAIPYLDLEGEFQAFHQIARGHIFMIVLVRDYFRELGLRHPPSFSYSISSFFIDT